MGTLTLEMTGGAVRPMKLIGDTDLKIVVGRFVFSSAYTTAGESLPASSLNLNTVHTLVASPAFSGGTAIKGTGIGIVYDHTNSKLIALGASAGGAALGPGAAWAEVSAHTDLSAFTTRFIAVGY